MSHIEKYKQDMTINKIITRYKSKKSNIRKMLKDLKQEGIKITEEELINKLPWIER